MTPHHALGHPCRAAGINEEQIVRRARDAESRSIAFLREGFIRDCERCDLRSVANFNEGVNFFKSILEFDDTVTELRAVNNHLAVRIIENVKNFLGAIAIIDVHMSQTSLKAGRHQLTVFRAVAHIESHLGAIASSALSQRTRDIIRTRGHFRPGDDPVAVYQGRSVLRYGGFDCVENVAEIPVNNVPSPFKSGPLLSQPIFFCYGAFIQPCRTATSARTVSGPPSACRSKPIRLNQ